MANGCAGNDFVWTRYRWQGSAYGVADQATCELCADPGLAPPREGSNRHPRCRREAELRRPASAE